MKLVTKTQITATCLPITTSLLACLALQAQDDPFNPGAVHAGSGSLLI
jgi:hypothetical protein